MFLLCIWKHMGTLNQQEQTENSGVKCKAGWSCLFVFLSHLDPPVHSQSLYKDLLLVGEFVVERCIRACHIKCKCFPLSNLITGFYGGISQHTERQSERTVIGILSFKVIYGICGIITTRSNGLRTTEMLMCSDGFNACSSGENLHLIDLWLFLGCISFEQVRHYRVVFITSQAHCKRPAHLKN